MYYEVVITCILSYSCIAVDVLRGGRDDTLRALISNRQVYLLGKDCHGKEDTVLTPHFNELVNCRAVYQGNVYKGDRHRHMVGVLHL